MTQKIRLLFLDQHAQAGGGQRVLADVCAHAASRSIEITVAAPAGLRTHLPHATDFVPMTLAEVSASDLGIPGGVRLLITSIRATRRLLSDRRIESPAAVVANGPRVLLAGALMAHKWRIPLFWLVHRYHRGWQRIALRWIARAAGVYVIAVSRSGLHSLGLRSADKHSVIPNGTAPMERTASLPLASGLRIASVGRLTLAKGHHLFAAACSGLVADRGMYSAEVIGDPTFSGDRDVDAITRACSTAGIRLRRLDGAPIPYDEIDVVVAASLPSQGEGCPLVVLEAMARGKVVVATDVPGIREVVQDRVTGFIVPHGEVAALTDTLRYLISHRDIADRTAAAAQAHARRWHNVHVQTRAVVGRILQGIGAGTTDDADRWQCGFARQPRIALIIDNWKPNKESGFGGSRYFHGLKHRLEANGAAVTVFTRTPDYDANFVPPAYAKRGYWGRVSFSYFLGQLADRFSEFDLVHSQSASSLPFLRYCREKGIPTIFDCCTAVLAASPALASFQATMLTLFPPDHVVFCDPMAHAWFARIHPGRSSYIPAPIDVPVAGSMSSVHPRGRRLLFAGRLAPKKGFDSFLQAIPLLLVRFPDLTIHVAGAGPLSESVAALASASRGRLVYHGLVPFHEMDRLYGLTDALIVPSRGEGVSRAAVEAMAHGVPVATTAVGGMRALVDLEVVERIRSSGSADIVDATARILDPARRSVLARRGTEYAASKHLWPTILPMYFAVYRKLGIAVDATVLGGPN